MANLSTCWHGGPIVSFSTLDLASFLRASAARMRRAAEEPLGLARLAMGALLLFGTIMALLLVVSGVEPRALRLVGAFWAIYGLATGLVSGVLEPVTDGLARAIANVGLLRAADGYSGIEALAARGEYQATADDMRVGLALADLRASHFGATGEARR